MSDAYVGEIRMFAGNYAPVNWEFCAGQLLSINNYEVLFNLIGTTYGGDGTTTFALPDLRGRVPIHQGTGQGLSTRAIGQRSGTETVTLTTATMPSHNHFAMASTSPATLDGPGSGAVPAATTGGVTPYMYLVPGTSSFVYGAMANGSLIANGGSQPHSNLMPTVCVSFIIALYGIYPSQS